MKWPFYQKQSVDSVQFPPKLQCNSLQKLKNNFIWKHKSLRTVKTILSIKRAVRGVPIPDFKLYYRAVLIKVV